MFRVCKILSHLTFLKFTYWEMNLYNFLYLHEVYMCKTCFISPLYQLVLQLRALVYRTIAATGRLVLIMAIISEHGPVRYGTSWPDGRPQLLPGRQAGWRPLPRRSRWTLPHGESWTEHILFL